VTLRTPVGRVAGGGAAHHGVQHWWHQRLTALALAPLSVWFVFALLRLPSFDYAVVLGWVRHPGNTVLLALLLAALAYHSLLGVRVVIEDYVHGKALKLGALIVAGFAHALVAAAAILAVLRLGFGAGP
jgi:succinate dehydrogenase / fumarate reductase membrane anchor subunit